MKDLKYVFYIGAQPEVVWDTLILPEGTKKTFYGSYIRSSFKVGDSLEYVGPGNDGEETVHVYGKLLAFEPKKVFSFTEHPGPSYHPNHAELESRVTIILEEVGQCTKLTLVDDQWTEGHPSYEQTKESWWMTLSNIKTYVETGKVLELGF
ncbi:SRPBCC domain-containing protein [Bacillaceae bacterium Marseille-Q3522]|nr:SRPBCC domain-containing protein [Bacillaceae bacterium Marseille-Q3522]